MNTIIIIDVYVRFVRVRFCADKIMHSFDFKQATKLVYLLYIGQTKKEQQI